MRKSRTSDGLKVHAIAGTYVVLLGFHLDHLLCDGLLGFSIHRTDHTEDEAYYLEASKCFSETDPGLPAGATYQTNSHPIQSFQWADYSAKPGHRYTYRVAALGGSPAALVKIAELNVSIETESPDGGVHDIYFNRGIAASQAYARRFGDVEPNKVPNGAALSWLSRGLYEALEKFVDNCTPGQDALYIAAYEFNFSPFLNVVRNAIDKGVEVRIIYDARKAYPRDLNEAKIAQSQIQGNCIPRTEGKSAISHNKFIVKVTQGSPASVWTGGTNLSEGGIYGHSNVAHVIEEAAVATAFFSYWKLLEQNPKSASLRPDVVNLSPLPAGKPPKGTTPIFSPRRTLDALNWYADLAGNAKDGLFMTFAFGMGDAFKDVYKNSSAPLRFALMESKTRTFREPADRVAEERRINTLRRKKENVFAIGGLVRTNQLDGWLGERLSGMNVHVRYVHNKFMLVDPLSSDPIIVAGSANFSEASTKSNDENMIVVRGNTRAADIYLGEFMRLYSHHAFRESLQWRNSANPPKFLRIDEWWSDYFGDTSRSSRRKFFAQVSN